MKHELNEGDIRKSRSFKWGLQQCLILFKKLKKGKNFTIQKVSSHLYIFLFIINIYNKYKIKVNYA